MAFTITDFQDMIRLLGEHPEWRTELRRHVLSDELLELPSIVRELAGHVEQLAARVEELAEAQKRTEAELAGLTAELRVFGVRQDHMFDVLGDLKGRALEATYRVRAGAYFGRIARRLRIVESTQLADLLDEAVDAGRLSAGDRDNIMLADLVLSGRRRDDLADVYLLAEISAGIGSRDVERAAERAALLARLGRPVLPIVAGQSINERGADLAHERGVWQVIDGRVEAPVVS